MQEYLAHKQPPPPQDRHRALDIALLQGPTGRWFLMIEVPLQLAAPRGPLFSEQGACSLTVKAVTFW